MLVVYPIISKVLPPSQVARDSFHQQSTVCHYITKQKASRRSEKMLCKPLSFRYPKHLYLLRCVAKNPWKTKNQNHTNHLSTQKKLDNIFIKSLVNLLVAQQIPPKKFVTFRKSQLAPHPLTPSGKPRLFLQANIRKTGIKAVFAGVDQIPKKTQETKNTCLGKPTTIKIMLFSPISMIKTLR